MKRYLRTVLLTLFVLFGAAYTVQAAQTSALVDKNSVNLLVGGTTKITPYDSSKTFTWKSSKKTVAKVGKKTGKVTGVGVGKCTITGKSTDGDVVRIKVRVYKSTKKAATVNDLTLIGHRGDTDRYPENSLLGIESAVERGWDGAEMDVFYTDSGEFVCFHDRDIYRMCGVSKSIYEITSENRYDYPLHSALTTDPLSYIPTVEEALEQMRSSGGVLYLHLKVASRMDSSAVNQLAKLILKYNMQDRVVIFGYNTSALKKLASLGFDCGLFSEKNTVAGAKRLIDTCIEQGYTYFFAYRSWQINKEIVDYAHENGIKAGLYKTLTKKQLMWLQDIGADFSMMYYRLA